MINYNNNVNYQNFDLAYKQAINQKNELILNFDETNSKKTQQFVQSNTKFSEIKVQNDANNNGSKANNNETLLPPTSNVNNPYHQNVIDYKKLKRTEPEAITTQVKSSMKFEPLSIN